MIAIQPNEGTKETPEVLLACRVVNNKKEGGIEWKQIWVSFDAYTFGFKKECLDWLLLTAQQWVQRKVLKDVEELKTILNVIIPHDIAEYTLIPPCKIKHLTEEQEKGLPQKQEKQDSSGYTGVKKEYYETQKKLFANKREERLLFYLESFYNLLYQLLDPDNERDYFDQVSEVNYFRKSLSFSLVDYFLKNINKVKGCAQYIIVFTLSARYTISAFLNVDCSLLQRCHGTQ